VYSGNLAKVNFDLDKPKRQRIGFKLPNYKLLNYRFY